MKSVYDKEVREELVARIQMLNDHSNALWGKMTVFQMLKHCSLWEEMVLNGTVYKRVFIGRIFGRLALKTVLKDDQPLRRNSPSIPELIVTANGSVSLQKEKWIALIGDHGRRSNPEWVHPFFGKMTKEQIGRMAYKHADHHLRQFAC